MGYRDPTVGINGVKRSKLSRSVIDTVTPAGRLRRRITVRSDPKLPGRFGMRVDKYDMAKDMSTKEEAIFNKKGTSFKPGYRPYSHKTLKQGKEGPLAQPKQWHGIERAKGTRVPARTLKKALKDDLPKTSAGYKRWFR